ncbi:MAG: vitamin K epoxide reductase family protein [Salinibacterium sp.]|nr:MAG: vitamin K epoxide reductase family protein [Salinibacterium sp.]
MSDVVAARRPLVPAVVFIITGAIGWYAAFSLMIDKIKILQNPDAVLDCNFGVLVQCGVNLKSAQGAVLGFPNPILGLGGFVAPIAVGVALLAGAAFARWFWITFNVGVAGAFAFCLWLAYQSIYHLGTLCPWCMLTWSVTIPLFLLLTLYNAREGRFGTRLSRVGSMLYGWVPALTLGVYLVIAVAAQLQLDVLNNI